MSYTHGQSHPTMTEPCDANCCENVFTNSNVINSGGIFKVKF